MLVHVNWNPTPGRLRLSAALLPILMLLPAWLIHRAAGMPRVALGLLAAALAVGMLGLLRPAWFRPVHVVLTTLGLPFQWLLSHVLMLLIFFGLLTPIGLLMRLAGYDPLHRRIEPERDSYWVRRYDSPDAASYFRPY